MAFDRIDVRTYQPKLVEAELGDGTSNGDSASIHPDLQPTYCPKSWVKMHLMRLLNE